MSITWRRCPPLVRCAALVLTVAAANTYAQALAVSGYWRTPSGAIVRVAPCGHALCVEIAKLPPGNHPVSDTRNPDPRLRKRPLCGLIIGGGFVAVDPQHARGGHLYDPQSGHTYSGQMTAEGNLLRLRGYVGLPLFGRTETWVRASRPPPCPRLSEALPGLPFLDPHADAEDASASTRDARATGRTAAARF